MTARIAGKVLKALYSALVAFLAGLTTVLSGSETLGQITAGQWAALASATVAAFGGTFGLTGWAGPRLNGNGTGGK